MSVTYLIDFSVKPSRRAQFLDLLNDLLDAMRNETMFINATLHSHPQDENRFLLHETWMDHQNVLHVQLKRPYREAWHQALPMLLEQPRELGMWYPVRADHRNERLGFAVPAS